MIDEILDTSIIIDLLRHNTSAVNWYSSMKRKRCAITPTVWMETVQGARNRIEQKQIIQFLFNFHLEHPTPNDNYWAMLQLGRFYLSHGVEFDDLMIASVAVRLQVPLYTLNLKHYAPLPNVDEQRPY